jgi:hypothetical protein
MLGKHRIIVDEWAEVWDLLKPYADASFWELPALNPSCTYIIGRVLLKQHWTEITEFATAHPGRVVFSNPAEGSETILLQLKRLRITEHIRDGRIGLLTSGDIADPTIRYCQTDCYFSNIVEYMENQQAARANEQFSHREAESGRAVAKPYDFLFLNGRLRPHRKALIDSLREQNLLDRALWTNLGSQVEMAWTSGLTTAPTESVRLLPLEYEIDRAKKNLNADLATAGVFVKHALFDNTWGDAIVNAASYRDTCFSLVTETIYDYPGVFRTEKIWKPVSMAHPFIVASCTGYYQSFRSVGFRTFDHLIDESFDLEENPHTRLQLIVAQVADVVKNGAGAFAAAATDTCKYNAEHLREYNAEQRRQLPDNLLQYLNERP